MSRSLIPNSTQIPDVILDHWMAHLSGAEFKVVMYIARRTYGFGKAGDTISLKQIVSGIRTKDGRQLDQGTGLNKDTVCKVLSEVEKKNIIIREQRSHEEYGDLANFYSLNLDCEFAIPSANGPEIPPPVPVSENPTHKKQLNKKQLNKKQQQQTQPLPNVLNIGR